MARLKIYDDPNTDILSVSEVKEHLRVDHSDEDTYIGTLIKAATQVAENYCGGNFINHAYELYMENWNDVYVSNSDTEKGFWFNTRKSPANLKYGGYYSPYTGLYQILLTKAPLASVEHIKYYDTNNAIQTWANTEYNVLTFENQKGFVEIKNGSSLPDVYDRADAVEVRYHCGYGTSASDVPEAIKHAVLLIIGNLYEKREDAVFKLPKVSEYLLDPYKIYNY